MTVATKMQIYNTTVRPHFLQSAGAAVLRKVEGDKLNSLHCAQLRRLLGIHYPQHLSNQGVYKRTGALPTTFLSRCCDIVGHSWATFYGVHVLIQTFQLSER